MAWKKGDKGYLTGILLELKAPYKKKGLWEAEVLSHPDRPENIGLVYVVHEDWLVPVKEGE